MYGFTIICNNSHSFSIPSDHSIHYWSTTSSQQYSFFYRQNQTFINDKIFAEDQRYIIGIDGVVLNLKQIMSTYAVSGFHQLVLMFLENGSPNFFNQFMGDFCGFVFDKQDESLLFFENQTGTKKCFYMIEEGSIVLSPDLDQIASFKRSSGLSTGLNTDAAYSLLTFGGMIEKETLIEGVYKLLAGEYIRIRNGKLTLKKYRDFNHIAPSISNKKLAIDKLDDIFSRNINLEYEKDIEYGYKHLATLSGGLDSRMNVLAANMAGYKTHNFCFSQPYYADHLISMKISEDFQNEYSFISLENGTYVLNLPENMAIYQGLIFYVSSAHYQYSLQHLDLEGYGIIHTGQIGDAVLGGFMSKSPENPQFFSKRLSDKLLHQVRAVATNNYASDEVFKIYNRLFNVTVSGSWVTEYYQKYLISPFLEADFIELCLSIDPILKMDSRIYIEWMNAKRPQTVRYTWERTGFKPNAFWKTPLSRYTNKAKSVYRKISGQSGQTSMNPYEHWYATNPEIKVFFDCYFSQHIDLLSASQLKTDALMLFNTGNTIEKTLAITLLEAVKRFRITT